jgi:hypothetical protein
VPIRHGFGQIAIKATIDALSESKTQEQQECREPNEEAAVRRNRLAEECGWQVGVNRFLWEENATASNRIIKKRSLGEGQSGKVEEITVDGVNVSIARKRFSLQGEKSGAYHKPDER